MEARRGEVRDGGVLVNQVIYTEVSMHTSWRCDCVDDIIGLRRACKL